MQDKQVEVDYTAMSVAELLELYDDAARDVKVCREALSLKIMVIDGEKIEDRIARNEALIVKLIAALPDFDVAKEIDY